MNTRAPFFPSSPVLRLPSRAETGADAPAAGTPASHASLAAELDAFREREANLRAYEERLRAWQAQLDGRGVGPVGSASPFARPASGSPFGGGGDAELQAAWTKFHRARALLEAEQNQLRDDRMALHETQKQIRQREEALGAREAALAEREDQLNASKPAARKDDGSAVERLTTAPFRMAKSIFKSAS